MTLSESVKSAVRDALFLVLSRSWRIDRALRRAFATHALDSFEDRGECVRIVYGITRFRRIINKALGKAPAFDPEGFERLLVAYRTLIAVRASEAGEDPGLAEVFTRLLEVRRFRESLPDWLDELGSSELGSEWASTIESLNRDPAFSIRVNTLKTTPELLSARLAEVGVGSRPIQEADSALVLDRPLDIRGLEEYDKGFFEFQDASSQIVSEFLRAEPGMRIIDACAGSGGKSLHLAAIMKNRGKIIALDTDQKKLTQLSKRALRAGAEIIEPRFIRSTKVVKRLALQADRLLLDVPCSGTGVLRRNPDTKWRLTPDALSRLHECQSHILSYYSRMVKPGGLMIYSNCSVFRSEGEDQIREFIDTHGSEFSVIEEKRIDPRNRDFDGFYMAIMKRLSL
jgi:16S rRNA (cytosine967-C5)-methyltransferase